ncbi:MAG: glycosyltransferase family 4 protein [Deltaproteobacteria bacterium]|nr:glycosyltransferase family 4 protein [Deltaproteobacteria bacterium]
MRVLMNTHPTAFFVRGGGEVQLQKTREHLQALGAEVDLFDMWHPDVERYDVVHMFSTFGGALPFHEHVRRRGVAQVLSPILWLGDDTSPYPMAEIARIFDVVDAVLPNSLAEQRAFEARLPCRSVRYHIVPNGVEEADGEAPGPEPFHTKFDLREFVLCVGNVEPRKNQLALARACRELGHPLALVGSVRDGAYLEACLRDGGPGTRHLGTFEHGSELLRSAYQACSVHALVSEFETPGLATLEAAVLGTRVVSTVHGSAAEYLGDGAEYVETDVESISAGIERALARPEPGDALRRRILGEFTWPQAARAVLDAYEATLTGRA